MEAVFILIPVLLAVLTVAGAALVLSRSYRRVAPGTALVITRPDRVRVTYTGAVVMPILHRADVIDLSVKQLTIRRTGSSGLICQDGIRADIEATFFLRINRTTEDILRVAQTIGCQRASDPATLEELFTARFSEAMKTVGRRLDFEQLYTDRDDFKDGVLQVIGTDLSGYILDDAAIDHLEQTPIEHLDPDNILDAEGIRKIRAKARETDQ